MLELYRKQFNEILIVRPRRKKDLLLANLMTQMESYYKLSMAKDIFDCETAPAVKDLYLSVSKARRFK